MRNNDWTRILGWPGYRVYQSEIDEHAKTLKLWVRRKPVELVLTSGERLRIGNEVNAATLRLVLDAVRG